jgi:hypothetical protein
LQKKKATGQTKKTKEKEKSGGVQEREEWSRKGRKCQKSHQPNYSFHQGPIFQ